jgi:hypothetical protein
LDGVVVQSGSAFYSYSFASRSSILHIKPSHEGSRQFETAVFNKIVQECIQSLFALLLNL